MISQQTTLMCEQNPPNYATINNITLQISPPQKRIPNTHLKNFKFQTGTLFVKEVSYAWRNQRRNPADKTLQTDSTWKVYLLFSGHFDGGADEEESTTNEHAREIREAGRARGRAAWALRRLTRVWQCWIQQNGCRYITGRGVEEGDVGFCCWLQGGRWGKMYLLHAGVFR